MKRSKQIIQLRTTCSTKLINFSCFWASSAFRSWRACFNLNFDGEDAAGGWFWFDWAFSGLGTTRFCWIEVIPKLIQVQWATWELCFDECRRVRGWGLNRWKRMVEVEKKKEWRTEIAFWSSSAHPWTHSNPRWWRLRAWYWMYIVRTLQNWSHREWKRGHDRLTTLNLPFPLMSTIPHLSSF